MNMPLAVKCAKCGQVARVLYKYEVDAPWDRVPDQLVHVMVTCATCGMRLQELIPPLAG